MSFLGGLAEELGARRNRLRAAFGERAATLLEFVLFSGIVLGMFGWALGHEWGWAPAAALAIGYVLLDVTRQRALKAGAAEDETRKRQDRLALILFAAMAAMGAAVFVLALQPPPPDLKEELPAPPPSTLDLEIVKER